MADPYDLNQGSQRRNWLKRNAGGATGVPSPGVAQAPPAYQLPDYAQQAAAAVPQAAPKESLGRRAGQAVRTGWSQAVAPAIAYDQAVGRDYAAVQQFGRELGEGMRGSREAPAPKVLSNRTGDAMPESMQGPARRGPKVLSNLFGDKMPEGMMGKKKPESAIDMNHQFAAPADKPLEARRNGAPQMRGNQGAIIGIPGEEDRKLQMALDSITRQPARSGSARRAQAEMFGAVIGRAQNKDTLEHDRVKGIAERDQFAAKTNMASGDDFADRQLKADMGNTEAGLKRRELGNAEAEAKAKAAAANSPLALARDAAELTKLHNQNLRDTDTYELGREGVRNKYADGRIAEMVAGGMSREQAEAQILNEEMVGDAPLSAASERVQRSQTNQVEDLVNEGTGWGQDLVSGNARLPFTQTKTPEATRGTTDSSQYDVKPMGGPLGAVRRFIGTDAYEVSAGEGNRAPRRYVNKDTADEILRRKNLERARAQRRAEQDAY